jgi:phosphatidylglycerophosphate synthase
MFHTQSSTVAGALPHGGVERRFRAALAGLGSAQKPGSGVPAYTRWVNRRLARFAAAAAYSAGWSPNAVTAASAALSFAALALMVAVPATAPLGVAVGVLLAAGYVLDSADGQVARLGGRGSAAGEWLDHVVDAIRTPALHLATLIGLNAVPGIGIWPLLIAIGYCLVSVGQFMSQILAEQLSGPAAPRSDASGIKQSLLLIPTDNGTLCWIFLLWGMPAIFVWVYGAMFLANTAHTAISMRRKYVRLSALRSR